MLIPTDINEVVKSTTASRDEVIVKGATAKSAIYKNKPVINNE